MQSSHQRWLVRLNSFRKLLRPGEAGIARYRSFRILPVDLLRFYARP